MGALGYFVGNIPSDHEKMIGEHYPMFLGSL